MWSWQYHPELCHYREAKRLRNRIAKEGKLAEKKEKEEQSCDRKESDTSVDVTSQAGETVDNIPESNKGNKDVEKMTEKEGF